MAVKFKYQGKTFDELKKMSLEEFIEIVPARERRTLKRGLSKKHKQLHEKIKKNKQQEKKTRTHLRDMIIFPDMVGSTVMVYNGKEYKRIDIIPEMIGHRLGEFSQTRGRIKHSSPGFGATRSSKFVPLK